MKTIASRLILLWVLSFVTSLPVLAWPSANMAVPYCMQTESISKKSREDKAEREGKEERQRKNEREGSSDRNARNKEFLEPGSPGPRPNPRPPPPPPDRPSRRADQD